MTDVSNQKRVLRSITSNVEKRLLIWISERMPAWVTPDRLTALGIFGAGVVFTGYALSNAEPAYLWLATLGLAINWLGDSADGTLARVRHIERPKYGFYIDHTLDVVSEGLIFLGIGVSPYVRFDIAALAFIGYLAMSVLVYVRAFVDGVFRITYGRLGPTELRILLAAVNAVMFVWPHPTVTLAGRTVGVYDLAVGVIAIGLMAAFLGSIAKGLRELADADA